jgi:hypothetical protein
MALLAFSFEKNLKSLKKESIKTDSKLTKLQQSEENQKTTGNTKNWHAFYIECCANNPACCFYS